MEYRRLGSSGLLVSALSFGTATFGGASPVLKLWGETDERGPWNEGNGMRIVEAPARIEAQVTQEEVVREARRTLVARRFLGVYGPLGAGIESVALEEYGPDFAYGHYAAVKRLPVMVGGIATVGAVAAAAQVGPLRRQLLKRVPQGEGPSERRRS